MNKSSIAAGQFEGEETFDADNAGGALIIPDAQLPAILPILPIPERPFFPSQIRPILLDRAKWEPLLRYMRKHELPVLGGLYYAGDNPLQAEVSTLPDIGCVLRVLNVTVTEQHFQLLVQGVKRFRVGRWLSQKLPLTAEVDYPENAISHDDDQTRAYAMALINAIKELLPLNPLYSEELKNYLHHFSPNEPSLLADFAAAITSASAEKLQDILETILLPERIEKVLMLVRKEMEVAKLQGQISEQVNEKVSKNQREFFLREQLKVIEKELGVSKDDRTTDIDEFRQRLEGKTLPMAARKRIEDEFKKMAVLETGSSEYGVTRNYLDWATAMPWGVHTQDRLDLQRARKVLDQHHEGLADIKDRIIEFLAVAKFKGEVSGSIILLVGPPGVGKTSIGKSIADTLGRKFYRFSLGGMRDEAENQGASSHLCRCHAGQAGTGTQGCRSGKSGYHAG